MKVYTYSEARQKLAQVLDEAKGAGEVWIRRQDGSVFKLSPVPTSGSPFESIKGIQTNIKREEIVDYVRESRETES